MPFTKEKKKKMLTELEDKLASAKAAVFVEYAGTKVAPMQELRKTMREQHVSLRVTKNTLLRKALEKNNLKIDDAILDKSLSVAFDEKDEVAPAKILYEKAKEVETLKILGALVNGEFYGPEMVAQLAQMPSREQLLGQVVGTIGAPISGFVNVLSGNLRGLINVLNQYKDKINK